MLRSYGAKEKGRQVKTRTEFKKAFPGRYSTLLKQSGEAKEKFDELFPSLRTKWDFKSCKADAKQYKTRSQWQKAPRSGYKTAFAKGWVDQCCKHMEQLLKSWDLKSCRIDARKYKTRFEWQMAPKSGYHTAHKNKWIDQCCRHMKPLIKSWGLKACKADAKNYKTRKLWRASSSGFIAARTWLHYKFLGP
jgi:hypothetical protein